MGVRGAASLFRASSAIPQLTDAEVNVGRMVSTVATATEEGSSIVDLWWKSGSTTGGAARSAPATWESSAGQYRRVRRQLRAVEDPGACGR